MNEGLNKSDKFSFDEYIKLTNISSLEIELIKCYMSLDVEIRNDIINHFKSHFSSLSKDENSISNNEISIDSIHPFIFKINEMFNLLSASEVDLLIKSLKPFFSGAIFAINEKSGEQVSSIMFSEK